MTPELAHVPLDKIQVSSTNDMFRDASELTESALAELIQSITEHNVLQPVLLRPKGSGKYELVAGERRFKASGYAGLKTIPAYIRELTDQQAFEMQVTENLERKDIHPLRESHAYRYLSMKDPDKNTVPELAKRFSKSEHYISTRLKLNDLIPEAKKDFQENHMTLGHALILARLQPADQTEIIKRCTQTHSVDKKQVRYYETVHEFEDFVDQNVICNLSSVAFKKDDATLVPKAGPCTTCPKRSGANQLFSDLKEKDRCFDPACFLQKRINYMVNSIPELLETEPDLQYLRAHTYGRDGATNPAIEKVLKDNKVKILERGDFSEYSFGKVSKIKGIYINGEDLGKRVTVYVEQKGKAAKSSDPAKIDVEVAIANIKQRNKRAGELDGEKVYARILEGLKKHEAQRKIIPNDFPFKVLDEEALFLRFIIWDKLAWSDKDDVAKTLKIKDNKPEDLYASLKKLTDRELSFVVRRVMMGQYGNNMPTSDAAYFIRKTAEAYDDIYVHQFEEEQKAIREKREERMKKRIQELKASTPKKDKKKQATNNKKPKAKKGLSALIEEEDDG